MILMASPKRLKEPVVTRTPRAVIYVRQSLDRTGEMAGVTRQEEACRGLATARGWDVVRVCMDNSISASNGKARPGWEQVLGMISDGSVDVVIAWHLDRMTRTMTDLERLILLSQDSGVGIATATGDIDLTTDTGRMVARILAAVARQEVERKGARQKLAAEQRATMGKSWWVSRPFGFEMDGTHRADEAESLQQAYRDLLAGSTLVGIAGRWNADGHITNYGNPWLSHTVRPVLLNARNAGISTYKGEEVGKGNWEPMVSEDVWRAVVHLLREPTRYSGGGGKPQGLLTGLATCGKCGATVRLGWKGKKDEAGSFRRYVCGRAGHVSMPQDYVDGVLFQRLLFDAGKSWTADTRYVREDSDVAGLVAEEQALTVRMDGLAAGFADGVLTQSQLTTGTERIRTRLSEVTTALAEAGRDSVDWIADDWEYMSQEFDAMDVDKQRALVFRLVDSVVLRPRGRGVSRLSRDDVQITLRGETVLPETEAIA